ncbi:hypothetical protein PCA01_39610 [Pseudoalteromonas carrageenovora]|nr:hypothetical protein PCA01_39610 [Pseudoalteromonas carrageenovora]
MPWSTGRTRAALLSSAWTLGYLLNLRQKKTRYIAVTGFFNLKPGNVVVLTAVESHIANATLSLCRDMSVC